ncbi:MAG TPA: hypothetical protein VGO43_13610 [Pyrinomonadaceae bacterium]|jgi:hypothetical protein|nr:hypothetical protein [Pyrinomonadaceae bacterium]
MNENLDIQIRAACRTIILGKYADAIVWPFNVIGNDDPTEWPGHFRRDDGTAHGWMIMEADQGATRKGSGQRSKIVKEYYIVGFYGFVGGGKIGENSDEEFSIIRTNVYNGFEDEPRLGFDTVVEKHDLLQYKRITTVDCGEETLLMAPGRLTVHLCC